MNAIRSARFLVTLVALSLAARQGNAQTMKVEPKRAMPGPALARPASTNPATALKANPTVADYPPIACSQGHPGEGSRVQDVALKGDSHMAKSVAVHTVNYALERFHLSGKIASADVDRAAHDLYEHMKWKLGNPTAIAGQFATAGYQHFDKAFSWEAAAALAGGALPSETNGPEYRIPPQLAEQLHKDADAAGDRLDHYLVTKWNIPQGTADEIASKLKGVASQTIDHLGINMPKSWNIDSNLVVALLHAQSSAKSAASVQVASPLKRPAKSL